MPDYWGRNLPVNRGQNNIDVIRYDCYRNATVAVEAFKAGEFDFRSENNSKEWGTAYDIPDVANGRMIKELIHHERPTGMQAFWFNTRRAKFADLSYFNPHSFRNTLVRLGQSVCQTPEEFKAWSQNLGHEKVLTTFLSYGHVEGARQGEIIRGLTEPGDELPADVSELAKALVREMRGAEG